jgi:hypothetical protein
MSTLFMWLLMIPMLAFAIRFWWRVGRFVLKNQRTLAQRAERLRSALAEAGRAEE